MITTLHSEVDNSVNFIEPVGDGFVESRYVHRPDTDYFIAYLSSHNGCNKACRFCHLTATGQTMMQTASLNCLIRQFKRVYDHYLAQPEKLKGCHVNFMARGEPLASPVILDQALWHRLSTYIVDMTQPRELDTTFRISTIMPREVEGVDLSELFNNDDEVIYYSLSSFDPQFRKRWLPKAMDPDAALHKLAKWQQSTGQRVKLHFSLISGENDGKEQIQDLIQRVERSGIDPSFNIVRFNSPDENKHRESEHVMEIGETIQAAGFDCRVIPRVGPDVFASCGMFTQ